MGAPKRRARATAVAIGLLATVFMLASPAAVGGDVDFSEADLTITIAGSGAGRVDYRDRLDNPVSCQPTCTSRYYWINVFPAPGVELTAIAAEGSTFVGWVVQPTTAMASGCGLSTICTVTMGAGDPNPPPGLLAPVAVTAEFIAAAPNTNPLTVLKTGTGQGAVTSSPAGVDCGPRCTASYPDTTLVTLTAHPAAGSTFTGWAGAGCTGTGACTVTMSAARTITATFTSQVQTVALNVTVTGPVDSGGVASSPHGIACPPSCTATYTTGSAVTLTATAVSGYAFQGWNGGGCTGTQPCTITLTSPQTVTAAFATARDTTVGATIERTQIRRSGGPPAARRQLAVDLRTTEDLARIVLRIRRATTILQKRTIRDVPADTKRLSLNIRNRITNGPARLRITLIDQNGNTKTQTRRIHIPPLP